jgi:hypothetical protein
MIISIPVSVIEASKEAINPSLKLRIPTVKAIAMATPMVVSNVRRRRRLRFLMAKVGSNI